ncbi:MAG TPA: hypothetical protein VGR35_11510 [Tepidisphaeraceae bacterium]|nr:hypothetical protein [Tepidisphaeraceae bacterium]
MNLPNAHRAIVEREKIIEYLLNGAHPDNGGKARFFTAVGFTVSAWEALADALRDMALNTPIASRAESVHGQRFILEGELLTPSGKTPRVRSIWIMECGSDLPRLVTGYPQS